MARSVPLPPSLWVATARPAPATPPLDMSRQADVAIVGAGYSGLAAALQLAEAGVSVIVLETGEPGWGASGRNGVQVISVNRRRLRYATRPVALDAIQDAITLTRAAATRACFIRSLFHFVRPRRPLIPCIMAGASVQQSPFRL